MSELQYNGWRPKRPHKPGNLSPEDAVYPATRIFDKLAFVGFENVCMFVAETSKGLLFIDCLFPGERSASVIEEGIKDLGLDPADVKYILITHGHADHFGCAKYFIDKYGAIPVMSEVDYKYAVNRKGGPHPEWILDFEVTEFFTDGQDFTLGDMTIKIVSTPGHTSGCVSFIIPVTDEGRPHNIALWGGTGITPSMSHEDKQQYLDSLDHFAKFTHAVHVDAEITTHPFVDNGIERMNVLRNIVDGVPNPFVIGAEAYKRYEQMFREMCRAAMQGV